MHRKRHIYIARESFSKPILRLFPAPSHFSCKGALTSQIILTVIIFSPEYSIKQCRSMHKDKKKRSGWLRSASFSLFLGSFRAAAIHSVSSQKILLIARILR